MRNDADFISLDDYTKDHPYVKSLLSDIVHETYLDGKSEYNSFLADFDQPIVVAPTVAAVPQQITVNNSLPKIEIEVFRGNLQDWPRWRDLYKSLVHQKQDMSSILKFCHLTKALEDEPKSLIKHFSISKDNYLHA